MNVNGAQYRLLSRRLFSVNGNLTATPFEDENVKVYLFGADVVLTTDFGLTIKFDGDHRHTVSLCDAYAKNVCGLCGNADGKTCFLFLNTTILIGLDFCHI